MQHLFGRASFSRLRSDASRHTPTDWFLPASVGLGLLLFLPLTAKGLPQAPDAMLHFFRAVAWNEAWQQGVFWPRWQTALYQGYGYPVFNFNGPLLSVITGIFNTILPNIGVAFKAMLLLVCIAYPVGMYLWARDLLGPTPAIVAAAAYAFATYRFYELYFLGNYAQFTAWSLFPWVLFFFGRLAQTRSRGYFLGAAGTLAALLLTHNISSLLFLPVLVAWVVFLAVRHRAGRPLVVLAAATACGLGMACIFVLPALAETAYTRVHVLTEGVFDVAANFLRPADLLGVDPHLDGAAVRPPLTFTFGRLHLLLAAAGALTLVAFRRWRDTRPVIAFALAAVLACAFLMLPPSLAVWHAVPGLRFVESPRRLYGIGFLFSSLLCGAALLWFDRVPRWRGVNVQALAAGAMVCGLIVAAAPLQFPRPFLSVPGTISALVGYETEFRAPGTTAGSEYLPPWVEAVPAVPALNRDLSRVALVNPAAGQSGTVLESGAEKLKIRVEQPTASEVVVAQFYFPGWQAQVDGVPVPVHAASGSGCIALQVPPGAHEILLEFGSTPVRNVALAGSLLALVATLVIALLLPRPRRQATSATGSAGRAGPGMLALVGVLLLGRVALAGPLAALFTFTSPPQTAQPAQYHTDLNVAGKVALLGYDLEAADVPQGQALHVRLYWEALAPLDRDYSSYVHLIAGPEGQVFAQSDHVHPNNVPTSTWPGTRYVVDDYYVPVPAGAPPVAYTIEAGLYLQDTGERLGSVELPAVVHVTETQPLRPADVAGPSPAAFGETIRLLGEKIMTEPDAVTVTLYWQAGKQPPAGYQVFVHGVDKAGNMLGQADGTPLAGLYPTSRWRPGQVIADTHRIELPAGARADLTALQVGLYNLASGDRLPATGPDGTRWRDDAVVLDVPAQ